MTPTVSSRPLMYFSTITASSQENACSRASVRLRGSVTILVPTEEPPEQGFTTQGKSTSSGSASPLFSVTPGGAAMLLTWNMLFVSSLLMASALPM